MAQLQTYFIIITAGTSQSIPAGWAFASINPSSGASYTITNSQGGDLGPTALATSSSITIPYTFPPCPQPDGYAVHTIAATGGSVLVSYYKS